ncbi:Major facilitator superfamily,Major facilitator superfamily domain [Cinara cedri]|uniref:Major facilitator superfamily,Major facilitator superfamily domain n=1 Tax=Cinara cedri TaxID=506608 RepID=A0A5E4MYG8_9HEMI|nr:Major facilitator superfamily,Major facilitator superfamily domain [Cinara cedri]
MNAQLPLPPNRTGTSSPITGKQKITVVILCFVNLINYMDRYTVAGILNDVQKEFNIGDDKGGLLQTAFVISYMICAPVFGYLGDRYNRRFLMVFGVFLWSLTTFVGSYTDHYCLFLFSRSLVGIGEASYSTIAPTIISDMFVKKVRSRMLALFYFAIPVGSGLGYIVGSEAARIFGSWHWGLRVTPLLGMMAILMILFLMEEPERGQSEGLSHLTTTSWSEDIMLLIRNRSFVFSTAGFTCVAFVTGSLAWWGPNIMWQGLKMQKGYEHVELNSVSFSFGVIAMAAGLIGVPLGNYLSERLKVHYPKADPLICAVGLLISAPFLFLGLVLADKYYYLVLVLIFIGQISLNLNWSIVADILLYVVSPNRRSTAEAFQILISHSFGDASSPYFIGVISEMLKKLFKNNIPLFLASVTLANNSLQIVDFKDDKINFQSLQYALFISSIVEVLGAIFFFCTARYIVKDKELAETVTSANNGQNPV